MLQSSDQLGGLLNGRRYQFCNKIQSFFELRRGDQLINNMLKVKISAKKRKRGQTHCLNVRETVTAHLEQVALLSYENDSWRSVEHDNLEKANKI